MRRLTPDEVKDLDEMRDQLRRVRQLRECPGHEDFVKWCEASAAVAYKDALQTDSTIVAGKGLGAHAAFTKSQTFADVMIAGLTARILEMTGGDQSPEGD